MVIYLYKIKKQQRKKTKMDNLNNIIEEIINKTKISPHWSSEKTNQEYKYLCDWYGREYYADTSSDICSEIINDYGLDKRPTIEKTSLILNARRNTWRNR
tara:strand:+ start:133 stop:432 length:300 start_codon:yes stop_codon:yes gene_type:complete